MENEAFDLQHKKRDHDLLLRFTQGYAGWLDGLLGVAGMMTLLLWIIPENSLPKTHQ